MIELVPSQVETNSCIMQTYKMFKHLFGHLNCFRIWIVQAAVSCKRCVVKAAMMQRVAIFVAMTYLLVFRTISHKPGNPPCNSKCLFTSTYQDILQWVEFQ